MVTYKGISFACGAQGLTGMCSRNTRRGLSNAPAAALQVQPADGRAVGRLPGGRGRGHAGAQQQHWVLRLGSARYDTTHSTIVLLRCRYNPQTGALWGAYQADMGGVTLAPSYSFAKREGALAVTRKLAGGQTLRATYALPDRLAVLELANKPFKARALPQRLCWAAWDLTWDNAVLAACARRRTVVCRSARLLGKSRCEARATWHMSSCAQGRTVTHRWA